MIPAPTRSALARIIAWRDSLYRRWAANRAYHGATLDGIRAILYGPPPKPTKNPRRVEGGKKAAITRKANAANRRYAELEAKASAAQSAIAEQQ